MSEKVETSFDGGPRGQNHGFREYFEVQATFLPVSTHHP